MKRGQPLDYLSAIPRANVGMLRAFLAFVLGMLLAVLLVGLMLLVMAMLWTG